MNSNGSIGYQRYGATITDPSAGNAAALTGFRESTKGLLADIKGLMINQENQIIKRNTDEAAEIFKQRVARKGLSILNDPIDPVAELKVYGNMVDPTAIGKTITEQTELLKNKHINQYSAGADSILASTGDPIAAREYLKQGLLKAGAPPVFADTEAANYDLRKAAEIKNIGIRDDERLAKAVADTAEWASVKGVAGGAEAIDVLTNEQEPKKRAAFKQKLQKEFNVLSAPLPEDEQRINEILKAHRDETESNKTILAETNKQRNAQTYSVNSSSGSSSGSDGTSRKANTKHTQADLVDKDGKPVPAMSIVLGNHVTNWVERLSGSSDAKEVEKLYKHITDKGISAPAAADILKQSYDYIGNVDGVFGNNISSKQIKDMQTQADKLIKAHHDQDGATLSSSSNSSSGRSGNISFTDGSEIIKYVKERNKNEVELANELRIAARNKKLGYTPDPSNPDVADPLSLVLQKFQSKQPATPTAAPTKVYKTDAPVSNLKAAVNAQPDTAGATERLEGESDKAYAARVARLDKYVKENGLKTTTTKISSKASKPNKDVLNAEVERLAAKAAEAEAAAKGQGTPQPTVASAVPAATETALQQHERKKLERQAGYDKLSGNTSNIFKRKLDDASDAAKTAKGQVKVVSPRSPGGWAWAKESDAIKYKLPRYNK